MDIFYIILLTFFSTVGAAYLLRDLYRFLLTKRVKNTPFFLITTGELLGDEKNTARAMLQLSAYLSRPEASALVRGIAVTKVAPQQKKILREAALDFCVELTVTEDEEITLPHA